MKNTIYASFQDPKLAQKAANALLGHGLKTEDLAIISGRECDLFGAGPLVHALSISACAQEMTGFLRNQGIESHLVATYELTIYRGGAILGATLPSGNLDEGQTWGILAKYSGFNVTSYLNRPYIS
jgi:hypothetical protein